MHFSRLLLPLLLLLAVARVQGQACTTLGQTPYSAFPVCASTDFNQQTVPSCVNGIIPTLCPNNGNIYEDLNPYWYKFTCYTTGTLAIRITPNNLKDDYDWQLFDVTNHNLSEVYTNDSLIVTYNWSGETGVTGTAPGAAHSFECGTVGNGPVVPLFSQMPTIIAGHEYLLMISHFSGSNQSGYSLSFPVGGAQGGTASIINPIVPKISNAYASCDGNSIIVKLKSKVSCKTVAADGSDFTVSGPVARNVVSASGLGCRTGFDTDSIQVNLNATMLPGNYIITAQVGTDGNTLADNCQNALAVGENATLKFLSAQPTPMDSMSPVVCIQDTLQLLFSKPMQCGSIAADGSDFSISGPASVTVKAAAGYCSNGLTSFIRLVLAAPIRVNGTFTITLRNGSDGNTIIDECGQVTPAGSSLAFTTKNITTADFQATESDGCRYDTVYLTHNAYGGTTQWKWMMDNVPVSSSQNTTIVSKAFGTHKVQLNVTNGFCSDSVLAPVMFSDHTVKASYAVADTLCPTDTLHFEDRSTATTTQWQWNFGNGVTSVLQFPPGQSYPLTGRKSMYTTRLAVRNQYGCADTAYKLITVLASCYIAVPSAFTPNGDGLNDFLYPLNGFTADGLVFRVYNRYGQVLFESRDWSRKWDGRFNGVQQPGGVYVWTLEYTERASGKKINLKGTSVLIR